MIGLFYTGAEAYLEENPAGKISSLGGYISLTPIENGVVNSLFPNFVERDKEKTRQTIAIAIKNLSPNTLQSVSIWSEVISDLGTPRFNFKLAKAPEISDLLLEKLSSIYNLPFNAIFVEATEENPLILGNIGPGEYCGVWIQRNYEVNNEYECSWENVESVLQAQTQTLNEELRLNVVF